MRGAGSSAVARIGVDFRDIVEASRDIVFVYRLDPPGFAYVSPSTTAITGYSPEDHYADPALGRRLVHPDDRPLLDAIAADPLGYPTVVLRWTRRDGEVIWTEQSLTPVLDERGDVVGLRGTVQDVTARVRADRARRALAVGNDAMVHATDEAGLVSELCRVVVEVAGYTSCWLAEAVRDERCSVRVVAAAGDRTFLDAALITWGDDVHGRGPTGTALRERETSRVQVTEERGAPWRSLGVPNGVRTGLSLPVRVPDGPPLALSIYAAEEDAFDDESTAIFGQLAANLGYALTHLRDAARVARSLDSLVGALVGTIELRDAYTAGHQMRVAALCDEIARRMALPEVDRQDLRLAAAIHDIGKVAIPAEILAAPRTLTDLEMDLVRSHAAVGADLLARVGVPQRVVRAVRQHHERLDGSGYPDGLAGGSIDVLARIIAVADTVEAMAHHRPYRAAPGLGAALEVVLAEAGTAYDPAVVEACRAAFAEGYSFDHLA